MFGLSRREWLLLAFITALALFLRLYRLDEIPPGLHHDEALNGLEAHELLTTGNRPIYIGSGFNGEPLLEYSIMLSEANVGMTPFAVRLPSALYGALTIPIVFLLAREMRNQKREVGDWKANARPTSSIQPPPSNAQPLASAFILTTLYWHLSASREGYKPVFLPLFGALTFLLLIKIFLPMNTKSPIANRYALFAAGLVLGLGFYTYPSIRFLYPVVALFVLFVIWRNRAHWKSYGWRALIIASVALLVFTPLGLYYLQNPESFFTRSNQVGIWVTQPNGVAGALLENTFKVAGMFFVVGDSNPRHNLPGRPAFDLILALGFIIGVARALWYWKQPLNLLLLTWLLAMLAPSIVTDAAPNFLRSLGAAVPAVILVTMGYEALLRRIAKSQEPRAKTVLGIGSWLLLCISALLSLNAYFNDMPHDRRAWFAFDVGLVRIAELVKALPASEPIYLTPFSNEQATIQFVLNEPRANFKWFDGRKCLVAPPSDHTATLLVVSEDYRTLDQLRKYWPQGRLAQQVNDFAGKPYLSVFQIPARPWNNLPHVLLPSTFDHQAMLTGYTLLAERIEAGQGVPLVLFWRAQQPMHKDYTVFSHLLGPTNPRTNTPLWGQNDHLPCAGSYATTKWAPGEILAEDFLIVVDKSAPAGSYQIEVGLYELANGARLKLPNGDDHVLLGPVEIFR